MFKAMLWGNPVWLWVAAAFFYVAIIAGVILGIVAS